MAAQGLISAIPYTAKLRQSPERYSADCSSAIERPLVILKLIFGKNNADIRIKTDVLTTLRTLLYSTTSCRVEERVSRKVCLVRTRDTIGSVNGETRHDVLLWRKCVTARLKSHDWDIHEVTHQLYKCLVFAWCTRHLLRYCIHLFDNNTDVRHPRRCRNTARCNTRCISNDNATGIVVLF